MENHIIHIEDRKRTEITQVKDIDSFNEEVIKVNLQEGKVIICGRNLNIEKLDLGDKKLIITGELNNLTYTNKGTKDKESLIKRIIK